MTTETKNNAPETEDPKVEESKILNISEGISLGEFAELIEVKTKDLVEVLNAKGFSVSTSDPVTESIKNTIEKILDVDIQVLSVEEEASIEAKKEETSLVIRPPVVTIMGHVDHGKTTLLDAIRESNIVAKESGGITQHIGAYKVIYNGHPITFVDTPGHEAFTKLRARGATVTDIVILTVAADDGVMPQTREAINHAKAADVPIIVAVNKIDKAGADPDKAKQQLSKEGLLVEDWGGDVVSIDISAIEKTNLNELLDMILLTAEMQELKANPNADAQGVVLEAHLDAKKGPVATVIIRQGTLKQGDSFICGMTFGKSRALFDENGKIMKRAEPSDPVEVLGFSSVPESGDPFQVVNNQESAKKISHHRISQVKRDEQGKSEHLTLDQLFQQIEKGSVKELPIIIKADVQGSVEVLNDTLPSLSTDQVMINIIHSATGNVSETDVILASASNAIIISYNTKPTGKIMIMAKEEGVEIRTYFVIYQLIEDIKKAMIGLLDPIIEEIYLGRAEIRRIFRIPRIGVIAGCYVTDGQILRNAEIRVLRNDEIIHKGRISSLKHVKENVTEVDKGYECGIGVDKFKELEEGDIIEAYHVEKTQPKKLHLIK
ncbi:translation initiation factor IF-2 [Acidobacteriota bacterium]